VYAGLPENWRRLQSWLVKKCDLKYEVLKIEPVKRKCPNIPVLEDYRNSPDPSFWELFPSKKLPEKPVTPVNVELLEQKIADKKDSLSECAQLRAAKCLDYLRMGGPSFQQKKLGPCQVKNSKAAYENGASVTDTIANWIVKGFVSGPFSFPPFKDFRSNSLLAVAQPDKVRLCLNVSLPENESFNSNIGKYDLEKMQMSSAKNFSHSILECGPKAVMSKFDFVDAYKHIPAKTSDLRLQGFEWLGKFFVENNMSFGGKPSVQNFDIVANTVKTLALCDCKIPNRLAHRQLDDVPVVAPKKTGWCEEFSAKYKELCDEIHMPLADDCPLKNKAFTCSTKGKVLGIWFDTENLSWKLPDDKIQKTEKAIIDALLGNSISLKQMQKLMGRLNHVSQMCPFLNAFRMPLNQDLAKAIAAFPSNIQLSSTSKADLNIWANFVKDSANWLPLAQPLFAPPLCTKKFVSDAAGLSSETFLNGKVGCGVIGLDEEDNRCLIFQLFWPVHFVTTARDKKGARFGNKSCTLEAIGLLLPFLLIPNELRNQHIVCGVDNMAVVQGWASKKTKNDTCASIFLRALTLIEAYLGSRVHVEHAPRVSDWLSTTADNLSRERTTTFLEKHMLGSEKSFPEIRVLSDWLNNPVEDWTLPDRILKHVMSIC
jgi:hypothetical protein